MQPRIARNILIAGLVFVFGWFGIDKFIHPLNWIGWMPLWMEGLFGMTRESWLSVIGSLETFLAAALLFPHRLVRKLAVTGMALHMIGILSQVGINDIFVRDVGIFAAACALFFLL